jgi:hypothetical protein
MEERGGEGGRGRDCVQPLVVLIHRGPRACWILVSYLSEGCVSGLTSSLTFSLLRREGSRYVPRYSTVPLAPYERNS